MVGSKLYPLHVILRPCYKFEAARTIYISDFLYWRGSEASETLLGIKNGNPIYINIYIYIYECASTPYLGWITAFPLVYYKIKVHIYQLLGNIDSQIMHDMF